MSDPVLFGDAKPGDEAFTYENQTFHEEFGWVADLEYFDDRFGEIKVVRKRWQLIEVDEIVLEDPYPPDDNDDLPKVIPPQYLLHLAAPL